MKRSKRSSFICRTNQFRGSLFDPINHPGNPVRFDINQLKFAAWQEKLLPEYLNKPSAAW